MKDDPQAPPPIDPRVVADEQIRINQRQMQDNARYNRVDQSTPFGGIQWTRDAEGNPVSMNMTLNPQDQARLDAQRNQMAQRTQMGQQYLNQVDTSPLDFSGLHPMYDRFAEGGGRNYTGAVNAPRSSAPPGNSPAGASQQPGPGPDYQAINPLMRGSSSMPASGPMAAAQALRNPSIGSSMLGRGDGPQYMGPENASPGDEAAPPEVPNFELTYQDYLTRGSHVGSQGTDGAAPPMSEQQWKAMSPEDQWSLMGGGMMVHNSDPRYNAMAEGIGETDRDRYMMAGPTNDWNSDWMVDPNRVRQGSNGVSYSTSGNESAANQANNDFGIVQHGWMLPLAAAAIGAMGAGAAGTGTTGAAEAATGATAAPAASTGAAGASTVAGGIDPALLASVSGSTGTGAATGLTAAPAIGASTGSSGFAAMMRNPRFLASLVSLLATPRSSGSSGTRR